MAKKTSSLEERTPKSVVTEPKPPQTPADEVVAVLLDLLRRADQRVTTSELEGAAKAAVETYRQISLDLAVRQFSG